MLRLEARTPDLVLLDVLMPDVNGIDVCRRIKPDARWTDLPIIFLSAVDDKDLIVESLEFRGVDYVTKPFNKAELLTRVRTHFALKRAHEDLSCLAEDKDELLGILAHDLGNHLGHSYEREGSGEAPGDHSAAVPAIHWQHCSKMLRRYGRLSARPTGGDYSTGLGLSIVKRLVETMNGYILVESNDGVGVRFTVRLPAAD